MRVLVREVAFREHQTAAGRKGVVNVPALLTEEYQNDCSVMKWDLLGLQVRCSSCITRGLCWGRTCVDLQFLYLTIYVRWRIHVQGLVLQGWVELVARAPFPCSTELQFVELLWSLWGSLHKSPHLMTKARTIPSILYFLCLIFHMKLTLLPHLAWLQYLLQWHSSFSFFFYGYDIEV